MLLEKEKTVSRTYTQIYHEGGARRKRDQDTKHRQMLTSHSAYLLLSTEIMLTDTGFMLLDCSQALNQLILAV